MLAYQPPASHWQHCKGTFKSRHASSQSGAAEPSSSDLSGTNHDNPVGTASIVGCSAVGYTVSRRSVRSTSTPVILALSTISNNTTFGHTPARIACFSPHFLLTELEHHRSPYIGVTEADTKVDEQYSTPATMFAGRNHWQGHFGRPTMRGELVHPIL